MAQNSMACAQTGWIGSERISGTNWYYDEYLKQGVVNQCQLEGSFQTINEGSEALIVVAMLQKGSIVVQIRDAQLLHRLNLDFGWRAGKEFNNVRIFGEKFSARSTGVMQGDGSFLIKPEEDQQINIRNGFQESTSFMVVVGGLTALSFNVPQLSIGWQRLVQCPLYRRR